MARKIRSDCRAGTVQKKYGLTLHNSNGRKTRSDKKVGSIRKGR